MTSPITFIAFNKPTEAYISLQFLARNRDIQGTPLYAYIDGSRGTQDDSLVHNTVSVIQAFDWPGPKTIIRSPHNQGCRNAVINAISHTLHTHEHTVIVEEDVVTNPYFYRFMCWGLDGMNIHDTISAVCANPQINHAIYSPSIPYYTRFFACWGWATTRRIWQTVDWDTARMAKKLNTYAKKLHFNYGASPPQRGILRAQLHGTIDSWAITFGLWSYLQDAYCLVSPHNMIQNTGWSPQSKGTHVNEYKNINTVFSFEAPPMPPHFFSVTSGNSGSIPVRESLSIRRARIRHYRPVFLIFLICYPFVKSYSLFKRVLRKFKKILST